jgi:membrane protease YdiL (CAAX protease family)
MEIVGFKWNKDLGIEWMIIGIPIALLGLIPTVLIEHFSGIITIGELLGILPIILTLLVTILAIGLGEEILFRGYLQTILETRYSFPISALISALLFGLLHFLLWTPTGKIENMVAILFSAGAIGLTFSYVFKTTKYNLILPVSIHAFWDFFIFIFQAEFEYADFLAVILEIIASIVGAIIIFILVYQYSLRRLEKLSIE